MKKERIGLLIAILLIGGILTPVLVNQAHATILPQTQNNGIICITSKDATVCPTSEPIISGPFPGPGSQFTVAVLVNSSQTLNGFDITLLTNRTILVPSSVRAGTVLANPHEIFKCIGGVNKFGTTPCPSTDTAGTIHYAVVGDLTIQHITGVLFYAVFNVTSNSLASPITFQTGCIDTSVADGTCVSIPNGSTQLVPENVQTAKFSNLAYFDIIPSSRNLVVSRGETDTSQFVTISSLNGFGGTTGTTVNISGSSSPLGPTVTITPNSLTLTAWVPGNLALAGITVNIAMTVPAGTYTLTITGTSGTLSNAVTMAIIVVQPDFALITEPSSLTVQAGSTNSSMIVVTSLASFVGTVFLSATVSTPGVTALILPSNITISGGSSEATARIIVVASKATTLGNYPVTITARSGTLSHSVSLTAYVLSPSFVISVNPITYLTAGGGVSASIVLHSVDNFSGPVTLTTSAAPSGLTATISPTSLTLSPNGYATSTLNIGTTISTKPGIYAIALTATNGTVSSTTQVQVNVVSPPAPDFVINAGKPVITIPAGGNSSTFSISLTSLYGFSSNVSLAARVAPPTFNPPIAILTPNVVFLSPGGSSSFILVVTTSRTTPVGLYTLTLTANSTNGLISHATLLILQVIRPLPVAKFTISTGNPIVGQIVSFDGSGSFDPDGTLVSWQWSFGNGLFTTGEFASTTYNAVGSFTVTLTVTNDAGLSSSTSKTVSVISQPAHDVSIALVSPQPRTVVSTQPVFVQVQLGNNGLNNENVSVTVYANGKAVQTLRGLSVFACIPSPMNFCGYQNYFTISWDTSGIASGNYTISASVFLAAGEVDLTPLDNSLIDGVVTVLPAPVMTLSPNSGPDGTRVLVNGTGFPAENQNGSPSVGYIRVNFDNMSIAFTSSHNGTFTLIFDVPLSQDGPHGIFALDQYSGAHASATFTVQSAPINNLAITIETGTVYFPGETAVAYIQTTVNGTLGVPQDMQLQVVIFRPDETNLTLAASSIGSGLFKATYSIPKSGPLGTYLVLAKAHKAGPLEASSLASFEVKLPWLSSNNGKITVGATTLAGVVGLVGLAWKKGYIRRKNE